MVAQADGLPSTARGIMGLVVIHDGLTSVAELVEQHAFYAGLVRRVEEMVLPGQKRESKA